MAQSGKIAPYDVLPMVAEPAEERWPVPQAAMFVTAVSAALWGLIIAGASWALG